MTTKAKHLISDAVQLRDRVEAALLKKTTGAPPPPGPGHEEVGKILHELQVHQIELEMQFEELSQAHLALDASRVRYFDLYDLAPVGYCDIGETGLIQEANLHAARLLGVPRNVLVKHSFGRFVDREDQDLLYLQQKQLLQSGGMPGCELRLVNNDGRPFWAHLEASVTRDERGTACIHLVFADISARKERDLAQERLAAIVAGSSDAIISRNLDGIIVTWNAAAEKLFGYSAAESIGQPIARSFPPGHVSVTAQNNQRLLRGETLRSTGCRLHRDGRLIDVSESISAISDESGDMIGVALFVRDISARKSAEAERDSLAAQLRESQKMQAIGTLAGGIAHDFNNILAAILGNTQLAREDAADNASALISLDEINKAAVRARDLVQQILTFSRRQPTERKVIALAPVVAEAGHFLRATLPPRLALKVNLAAVVPQVLADETQIEQVIINLASNAMQAMRGGAGQIDINLEAVNLDAALARAQPQLQALYASHPGRTLRLSVRDDGPGMDAATLERIFEPFFTTKPAGEGTGLGLSVVHGIVQTHEGVITVASTPGEGTTFTVYLPAAAPGAALGAATVAEGADGAAAALVAERADGAALAAATAAPALRLDGGLHILYLDDDDALVFLASRLLERRGHRISAFGDQREALDALRADPQAFDLLLTDYNMRGMSGIDVAREARAIRADLPVAIASGYIDEPLRLGAAAVGVHELVFKATDIEEFCQTVQRVAQALTGARPGD